MKKFISYKQFSVKDFGDKPENIFTAHELAAMLLEPSIVTKLTVQFNLFGGTLFNLGSERHFKQIPLDSIDSLNNVGCFGFTELGYGNNAIMMETTATYDQDKKEWVINSPTPLSKK